MMSSKRGGCKEYEDGVAEMREEVKLLKLKKDLMKLARFCVGFVT